MRNKKFIHGYLGFLKATYPIPSENQVEIIFHEPESFPLHPRYDSKYLEGLCWRLSDHHYKLDIRVSKHRQTTCFRLGHEYKHVLQFCYEGMQTTDEKLKGLGYVYKMWEIPANYFASATLEAYKMTLK